MDQNKFTAGILLDLSKAFDTVDHSIIIPKLEHYGIRGIALEWFKNYLTNRNQIVTFYNTLSNKEKNHMWSATRLSFRTSAVFDLYERHP